MSVAHGPCLQHLREDHREWHTLHFPTARQTGEVHPHAVPGRPVGIDMRVMMFAGEPPEGLYGNDVMLCGWCYCTTLECQLTLIAMNLISESF